MSAASVVNSLGYIPKSVSFKHVHVDGNMTTSQNKGASKEAHCRSVELGTPLQHFTKLIIDSSVMVNGTPDGSGTFKFGVGIPLYSFPSVPVIRVACTALKDLDIQCTSNKNVQAKIGLGMLQAQGAIDALTGEFENIHDSENSSVVCGAGVQSTLQMALNPVFNKDYPNRTLHLNLAGAWKASEKLIIKGEVLIEWVSYAL